MRRWIERYRDGNHRQVWIEMTSLGPGLRSDETALSEATAVAGETMRRARNNVERLVERLPRFGFEFQSIPLTEPSPDARTSSTRWNAKSASCRSRCEHGSRRSDR